jgi:hypothetical protein
MKKLLRVVAWLAAAAGAIAWFGVHAVDLPVGAGLVYAYALEEPVAFTLQPEEREIKVITWLLTDDTAPADPRAGLPYAVLAEQLDADGAVVRSEQSWTIARAERWEDEAGRLLRTAWIPDEAHTRVHAARLVHIRPGDDARRGGSLRLSVAAAPPGARVVAIVYRLGERSFAGQLRLRQGDAAEFRADVAEDVGATGWDALPESWRENAAAVRWDRLGALSTGTGLVPTTRLARAQPVDGETRTEAVGLLLSPGGAATWTLLGPVELGGTWAAPDGSPAATRGRARVVHPDGTVEEHTLEGPTFGPWKIEGAAAVYLASDAGEGVRWVRSWVTGEGSTWGAPPERADAAGRTWIAPDLRSEQLYRAGPDAPLAIDVAAGEVLRLGLRPRLAPGPLPGLDPAASARGPKVKLAAVGADGAELGTWSVGTWTAPSAFERYTQGDGPATARVSDETSVNFRVPDGAARLVITPADVVDVSTEVGTDASGVPHPAYDPVPVAGFVARFAPHLQEAWRARAPRDAEALALAGRVIRIDGQVRLEQDEQTERHRLAHSLPLPGAFDLVAEARMAGAAANRVRLGARGTTVQVPPSGRLRVDYRVAPTEVGAAAPFRIAGLDLAPAILATAGELRFDGLPPGPVTASVTTPGLFLARAEGSAPWQTWRVRRMDEGERLVFRVPPGHEVSITPFVPPGGRVGSLTWHVAPSQALPAGVFVATTDTDGTAPIEPDGREALPLSFAGPALRRGRDLRVPVGDDVGPGGATVTITINGAGGPVWVRARGTWNTRAAASAQASREQ